MGQDARIEPADRRASSPAPATEPAVSDVLGDVLARLGAAEDENRRLAAVVEHLERERGREAPRQEQATSRPESTVPTAAAAAAVTPAVAQSVSRRGLLVGAVGAAGMGAVALVASASPAAANGQGQSLTLGDSSNTASQATGLTANIPGPVLAVVSSNDYPAVRGQSGMSTGLGTNAALVGDGHHTGVAGLSVSDEGVFGLSQGAAGSGVSGIGGGSGVKGFSQGGNGVLGVKNAASTLATAAGVVGDSSTAPGVAGFSGAAAGVTGLSTSGSGTAGVAGAKSGFSATGGAVGDSATKYGVAGLSNSASGVRAASVSGAGVQASSTTAVGGQFTGGRAAVSFTPTTTSGRPTAGAHSAGDIMVDNAGAMYLCRVAGTPGTWVKFTTTPA